MSRYQVSRVNNGLAVWWPAGGQREKLCEARGCKWWRRTRHLIYGQSGQGDQERRYSGTVVHDKRLSGEEKVISQYKYSVPVPEYLDPGLLEGLSSPYCAEVSQDI